MTRQYVKTVYIFLSPSFLLDHHLSQALGSDFPASVSDFPVQSTANQLSLASPLLTNADQLLILQIVN